MSGTRLMRTMLMLCLVGQLGLSGCMSQDTKGKIKPVPRAKAAIKAVPLPVPKSGQLRSSMSFPSAVRSGLSAADCCAKIVLDKVGPSEVAVGELFEYTIKASNRGNLEVREVKVSDILPDGFQIASSSPQVTATAGGKTTWDLGALTPNQSATITIKGQATRPGPITNCATVTYVPYICVTTNVIKPALRLTKTLPAEVLLCESIPVKFTVTNSGTGTARGVVIRDQLPNGLVTQDMKTSVTANVGDLAAGQSRAFTANLKATKAGSYTNTATATGGGGLKSEASATTVVREPKLTIKKTGPERLFIGRSATYQIVVSNTGDGDARNAVVEDAVPANGTFISASGGGTQSGGKVTWNLGTLKPKDSRTLTLKVKTNQAGTVVNSATARAHCAKPVSDSTRMTVTGIPAVLLEVVDIEDPIEVGSNETYVITVTNQGSAPDTNISIVCTLENAMGYVSSSGATSGSHAGNKVTFRPLASLAPKARATWRVVLKAKAAGDVRFKATMNTDQLGRPVEETEATNYYQ